MLSLSLPCLSLLLKLSRKSRNLASERQGPWYTHVPIERPLPYSKKCKRVTWSWKSLSDTCLSPVNTRRKTCSYCLHQILRDHGWITAKDPRPPLAWEGSCSSSSLGRWAGSLESALLPDCTLSKPQRVCMPPPQKDVETQMSCIHIWSPRHTSSWCKNETSYSWQFRNALRNEPEFWEQMVPKQYKVT